MITSRNDVTEMIVAAKVSKGLKWEEVAAKVGLSKEWVTAACLGQMALSAEQAATVMATPTSQINCVSVMACRSRADCVYCSHDIRTFVGWARATAERPRARPSRPQRSLHSDSV